jgi:hypothetical protein
MNTLGRAVTDADVVRLARKIDRLSQEILYCVYKIEEGEHPHAMEITDALQGNGIPFYAWATHVVSDHLEHPERWETGNYGIKGKGR